MDPQGLDRERLSYTLKEAERATGISRETLMRAMHTTEMTGPVPYLPAHRIGPKYLILADDLRAWLERLPSAESYPPDRIEPRSSRSQAALDASARRRRRAGWGS